jgi:hypothetical protein
MRDKRIPGSFIFLLKRCPLERADETAYTVKVSKWREALSWNYIV